MSGFFVALEGADGAGKSTQAQGLAARLEAKGHRTLLVREPGGTPLGEAVRQILLGDQGIAFGAEAEMLLFLACRVQLYEEKIAPALAAGKVVISDRYHLSTIVYQGIARGLGEARVATLCEAVLGTRRPRLNLVLELPAEMCRARRSAALDRIEAMPGLLEAVVAGFAQTRGAAGDRIVRISAAGTPDDVAARVFEAVSRAL
ncbi:MAG: dTMP kinase [Planctomycetes bacterium]|nr:dTMP kinase [Planctomycetota bacterium]